MRHLGKVFSRSYVRADNFSKIKQNSHSLARSVRWDQQSDSVFRKGEKLTGLQFTI